MNNNKFILIFLISASLCWCGINSMRLTGLIHKEGQPVYQYIGKFCFENNGEINVNINWGEFNNNNANLYLYSDTIENVQDEILSSSCEKSIAPSYQFNISNQYRNKVYKLQGQRDRFWYFVLSNCGQPSTVSTTFIEFDITMTNLGDKFDKHLSADLQSVPQAHIFYAILCLVLFTILKTWFKKHYDNHKLQRHVLDCLAIILLFFFLALILFVLNWSYLIMNYQQRSTRSIVEVGNWVYIFSKNIFYLLLIIVGQGWTTSIYYGSIVKNISNFAIITFNIAVGWALSYINNINNHEILDYRYYLDTVPGYISLVLYGILTIYFIVGNFIAHRNLNDHEPIKKTFLKIFTGVFSLYFISPIIIAIISHYLEPWIEFKVVTILNHTVDHVFIIVLMYLFRPTLGNKLVSTLVNNTISIELKNLDGTTEADNKHTTININKYSNELNE